MIISRSKYKDGPTRNASFATLAMHSPRQAATELSRTVTELDFKGALVHGHTNGRYYDDPAYDVLWESLEALDVPLSLHPLISLSLPRLFKAIRNCRQRPGRGALKLAPTHSDFCSAACSIAFQI